MMTLVINLKQLLSNELTRFAGHTHGKINQNEKTSSTGIVPYDSYVGTILNVSVGIERFSLRSLWARFETLPLNYVYLPIDIFNQNSNFGFW